MKKIRTRRFRKTFYASLGVCTLFTLWFAIFGRRIAVTNFEGMTELVFCFLLVSVASFFAFCFLPCFCGEKRWYGISALYALVFFAGTGMLWYLPVGVIA